MTTEDAFYQTLEADPADVVTRLIYADWLEDQDPPRRVEANGQRWQVRNQQWPRYDKHSKMWDWWCWTDGYLPHEFELGYFEAVLPDDVFCGLITLFPDSCCCFGALFTADTLQGAETALAQALDKLGL